ncbi:MAG: DUF1080 domain-containing protein [Candidatus Omnitrophica bacterium]|nr:DUF1080 domain-containing protein [Candidatus Omnitrophota bacterium]
MKRFKHSILMMTLLGILTCPLLADAAPQKIKTLVVTGGHGFEPAFITIFNHPDIEYVHAEHPNVNSMFTNGDAQKYDVIVLYDLWQDITDEQKKGMLDYLKSGKGLVSLHHSIANYQDWPEYLKISGTRYILDANGQTIDGRHYPQSQYKHDVLMDISVVDKNHPITRGLSDFQILDEAYKDFYVSPDAHILLTTDSPLNDKNIAWTMNYHGNEIVFLQLGHDSHAFFHPSYRHLVAQAIRFAAKRPLAKPLFNGNDLSEFTADGNAAWKVENGLLIGRQGPDNAPGDLFTRASYSDFALTLEYKVQWPANSGVWFRYQNPQTAYQADILEYKNPLCWSGSLYCPKDGPFLEINENASLVKRYDWNSLAICCQGDRLQVVLNGETVADLRNDLSAEGKIGFQVHQGDEFKDMEIRVRNAFILPLN